MTEPKRIVIADDDRFILEAMTMILEDEGYIVETVRNGAEVEKHLDAGVGVLLLDVRMSGMDGSELCKHFKSQPATRHIPVILFSANRETQHIAQEVGADDFLVKPFELSLLLAKLQQYM